MRGFNGHVAFGLLLLGNDRFDKVQTELAYYFYRLGIVRSDGFTVGLVG